MELGWGLIGVEVWISSWGEFELDMGSEKGL